MSVSIYQNLRTERQYKASTGLSISEFEYLFSFFDKLYFSKNTIKLLEANDRRQPVLTDKREALFFILYYFKTYCTLQTMGLSFGMSDCTASNYIDRLKPYLKASCQAAGVNVCRFFESQEHFDKVFEGVTDIIIDVTETPIQRPEAYDTQKTYYSGKKKCIPPNGY